VCFVSIIFGKDTAHDLAVQLGFARHAAATCGPFRPGLVLFSAAVSREQSPVGAGCGALLLSSFVGVLWASTPLVPAAQGHV